MSAQLPVSRATFDEVMIPCYNPSGIVPVKGLGSRVWDQNDREYIDLAGGIAVSSVGHCHPKMVQALTEQAQKLWHVSNVMTNEPALQLAQSLVEATFAERVFFANSGAEANEAALKLARRYAIEKHGAEKTQIISFQKSFHGRSFFTVTVGGQAQYSDNFGPKPGDVVHVPFNDIAALEAAFGAQTCAVMMEPIQGEGGIVPAEQAFFDRVQSLCQEHDALLILDEVQTGFGRTGHLFAHEKYGITPDIMTCAKSMGGGFPIGAMLTTEAIGQHLKIGTHGSTYGGNPLACAVGLQVLSLINQPEVLTQIQQRAAMLKAGIEQLGQKFGCFSEVRGEGFLLGAQLSDAYLGQSRAFLQASADNGLLVLVAGADVVRFTPSLLIEEAEIKQALAALESAIQTVVA